MIAGKAAYIVSTAYSALHIIVVGMGGIEDISCKTADIIPSGHIDFLCVINGYYCSVVNITGKTANIISGGGNGHVRYSASGHASRIKNSTGKTTCTAIIITGITLINIVHRSGDRATDSTALYTRFIVYSTGKTTDDITSA